MHLARTGSATRGRLFGAHRPIMSREGDRGSAAAGCLQLPCLWKTGIALSLESGVVAVWCVRALHVWLQKA